MGREKILITGGAGYIGSHVAWAAVDRGQDIVVVDNLSTGREANIPPGAEFIKGDVKDQALMTRVLSDPEITSVMHFAGRIIVPESFKDPIGYYQENTLSTVSLLGAMVETGTKTILFSSTAAVYKPTEGHHLVSEDDPVAPLSPYGQSKLMSETIIGDAAKAHGLNAVALRYFNVAGADPEGRTGQSGAETTHLLRVAVQTAIGLREKMTVFGTDYPTPDGTCMRDFIHVSDLAAAHILGVDHIQQRSGQMTLNCGYGRGSSVMDMIHAVEEVIGGSLNIEYGARREGDAPVMIADPSRIREALDWSPRHDNLREMASTAISWERRLLG